MDQWLADCRSAVLNGIAGPFGRGKVVAAADKAGGNVDTIHNVRNKDENGNAAPIFRDATCPTAVGGAWKL
jgi:hypothetical protein